MEVFRAAVDSGIFVTPCASRLGSICCLAPNLLVDDNHWVIRLGEQVLKVHCVKRLLLCPDGLGETEVVVPLLKVVEGDVPVLLLNFFPSYHLKFK